MCRSAALLYEWIRGLQLAWHDVQKGYHIASERARVCCPAMEGDSLDCPRRQDTKGYAPCGMLRTEWAIVALFFVEWSLCVTVAA